MKYSLSIVDTEQNLVNSPYIIPDGMIIKIANASTFKLGDGVHRFSELPTYQENVENIIKNYIESIKFNVTILNKENDIMLQVTDLMIDSDTLTEDGGVINLTIRLEPK